MWWGYYSMIRVFKQYTFRDPVHPGTNFTVQFSSYPGWLIDLLIDRVMGWCFLKVEVGAS
jgi:hypothetical protein